MILLIGLAVGVDYSLFYLRREREERAAGHAQRGRAGVAAATSGRAVLVSGLTVMIAMAGMFLAGNAIFTSFAVGTILVVAVAVLGSLTVLPAVLSKLGDRVEKGRVPFLAPPAPRATASRASGAAILDRVLRRPLVSAVARRRPSWSRSRSRRCSMHTVNTGRRRPARRTCRSCRPTTASRPRSPAARCRPWSSSRPTTSRARGRTAAIASCASRRSTPA